jgi:hypothetical protein
LPVYRVIPTGDLALTRDPDKRATGLAALGAGGSLVVIEGVAQVRQRLATRFKFFQGEWFLDTREGIPYYRDVLVAQPDLPLIRSMFRRAILDTPGVLSLPRLTLSFDRPTRTLSVAFQAVVNGGVVEVLPGDKDFLVDLPTAA